MKRLYNAWIIVCLLAVALPALASGDDDWLPAARATLQQIRDDIASPSATPVELHDLLAKSGNSLAGIASQSRDCIAQSNDDLQKLHKNLDTLDATGASSDRTVEQAKKDLTGKLDTTGARLASCQALLLDTTTLAQQVKDLQTRQLESYLLARNQPLWSALEQVLVNPAALEKSAATFLDTHAGLPALSAAAWAVIAAATAAGALLGFGGRRFLVRVARSVQGETTTQRFYQSLCACFARLAPVLAALIGGGLALALETHARPEALPLAVVFTLCLTLYLLVSTSTRVLLAPCPPAQHFARLDRDFSVRLNKRLRSLWLVGFLAVFLSVSGLHHAIDHNQWTLVRATLITVLVGNLVWLALFMSRASGLRIKGAVRVTVVLVLAAALIAELTGYHNLSFYLLKALLGSVLLGIVLWMGNVLIEEFFDGMDQGQHLWQKRLRATLGLADDERIPGLLWLRLLSVLTLWFLFGLGILEFWGYSDTTWLWIKGILHDGFQVGAARIVPLHIALGLGIFALFLTGLRWFRQEVLPQWVSRSRLDRGGREAVVTLTGYVGIIAAALIGLVLAGFSLQNLAIIAGALSVGIGFGLQNIVNNFVSGIILLFERPIRTGDWIVTGDVQGYVRRISIRSTLIETFDRADVIVPNSALISGNVTNWMLRDPWGRITVPVGVAYGSDVEKVTALLLEAAREHPMVMLDGKRVGPPLVLFRGFGDSSLDFELRCFIRQVDHRLTAQSDLNYAIEKKFREAGVEIPFPQRDVHLRGVVPQARPIANPPPSPDTPGTQDA